jgi:hypothetical protein
MAVLKNLSESDLYVNLSNKERAASLLLLRI